MEASSHRPTTNVHAYEDQTTGASRRKYSKTTTTAKRMGAAPPVIQSKCYGYVCRKDTWKSCWKRRDESSNDALRRVHPSRRIPPTRMKGWETTGPMQS